MIEVEIRGKLDSTEFQKLKEFLEKEGTSEGSHDREMVLLRDYPGFSEYRFHDIEWSLVDATGGHFYFEAEKESSESGDVAAIHENLVHEAQSLGLSVLNPEEMRDFIFMLDKAVNKEIEW